MKQKKLYSLGIMMLLALSQLFAQKQIPALTLKPGDWFETVMRVRNIASTFDYHFDVKYQVSSKMPNGNIGFKVSIERMRLKYSDANNTRFGYDSYYPPYIENRKKNLTKQVYEITTDSQGKILKLNPLSTASKITFSFIDVKTKFSATKTEFSSERLFPNAHLQHISESIISSLIAGKALAKTIDLSNTNGGNHMASVVLKSASFKLLKNSLIKGNITNLPERDTIYAVDDEIFRFNKDGSFSANVLAGLNSRRRWIFGEFDEYKTFSVLFEPSDTLIVKADALDFDNTLSFAGNAAAKASLSKDLVAVFNRQWINESNYRSKSAEEFLSFQKQGLSEFDGVINKYTNRVSPEIISNYIAEMKYVQAGTKLMYISEYRKRKPNPSVVEFPKSFFVGIDTLPVLMSGLEGGLYYDNYLRWLKPYKTTKLGMVHADKYGFYTDYATSLASFEGYPLYFAIYESLRKELHKNEVESTERLKMYYEDFIHNCGDTTLTNRIKQVWTQARRWLPGNLSPVQKLFLQDGSALDLAQFKGKPLVLIVNYNNPDVLRGYIDLIKTQYDSQVHFVIAQSLSSLKKSTIDQKLKDLPNVTYVELSNDGNTQKNFDIFYQQTKVFTFTSDFRVLSSYLFDASPDEHQVVEGMFKNAIDSSVMTKEQKASLITTIGWSVCSALLTLMVVFYVYRARTASLRKKSIIKNKIKDLEIKAIRSQMNPHFMFNALNSIQSMINNNQYNEANVYLEKFSLLMRTVLNNSEKSFVTLSDELNAIILYCELEQLRFNFKFELEISPEVNTELIEIPGMIIHPLVENSILHGLAQKGDAGQINMHISCDEKYLHIVIKDNGTGLKEYNAVIGHKSFGLKLVKERLILLSSDGNIGNLHLSSNLGENKNGVTAVLTIPID